MPIRSIRQIRSGHFALTLQILEPSQPVTTTVLHPRDPKAWHQIQANERTTILINNHGGKFTVLIYPKQK